MVAPRSPETVNPKLPTGEVEIRVDRLEVLSAAPVLPFQLDEENVDETLRLHHRYLDLRRDAMRDNLRTRFAAHPDHPPLPGGPRVLGARDADPVQVHARGRAATSSCRRRLAPGQFYALPQSPQLFKQLYVIAGYERYYQIARCFRDEAPRADRQHEFTQLDIEMAFVEPEELFGLMRGAVRARSGASCRASRWRRRSAA